MRFQRFQHTADSTDNCKVSPKLPVLPTNPAGSFPSADAAGTDVDRWDWEAVGRTLVPGAGSSGRAHS